MPSGTAQPTTHGHFTCTAHVTPTMLHYIVTGAQLELMNASGQTAHLTRTATGVGGRPLYGTWLMSTDSSDTSPLHLQFVLKVKFGPNQVSAIAECSSTIGSTVATATSPAVIDDTTIDILEDHMETKEFSR